MNQTAQESFDAIVITPTVGDATLAQAVASVCSQKECKVLHLVVIDGRQFEPASLKILNEFKHLGRIEYLTLPFNTGGNGYNGHCIYAMSPFILNAEYFFFLDQDNWYDDMHVVSLINLIKSKQLEWAYSMRKICNHEGVFVTLDNCESLGRWPSFSAFSNLVDTNCYAVKREVMLRSSYVWHHPRGADRVFYKYLSTHFTNFGSTAEHTVNYRLHKSRPPHESFFLEGNRYMQEKYHNHLPWSHA